MILNLTDLNKSEIKYKINNYPDGQSDVQIIDWGKNVNDSYKVRITSRFNSFKDLELILCATKAFQNLGVKKIELYIPYILGSRSDRKFATGGVSYLRDIIAPIINAQNYATVTVLDPHSDVVEAVINNLVSVSNVELVKWAFTEMITTFRGHGLQEEFLIVSPDAGALKKIYNVAKTIDYTDEIVIASKHRDIATGQILSTEVPNLTQHQGKDFVIIDDICDGARTFIEIAKKIKQELPGDRCGKIFLIVTHGIFSNGFGQLSQYFDGIYCTNSIVNHQGFDWYADTDKNELSKWCKQLNVF